MKIHALWSPKLMPRKMAACVCLEFLKGGAGVVDGVCVWGGGGGGGGLQQKPIIRRRELQCWSWLLRCPGCQLSNHVARQHDLPSPASILCIICSY